MLITAFSTEHKVSKVGCCVASGINFVVQGLLWKQRRPNTTWFYNEGIVSITLHTGLLSLYQSSLINRR